MLPLLSTLSKTAKLAYPIIQAGVFAGVSANSISDTLKAFGLGVRRQTLLDIIRAERGIKEYSPVLKSMSPTSYPNPDRLPSALTPLRRKYSFTVEVKGALTATGEPISQFVTVTSDSLMSRAEIEETAMYGVETSGETYGIDVESSTIVSGKRAGTAGVL